MTDRELDALVAEKVMGWHRGSNLPSAWFDDAGTFRRWVVTWIPSTDIAAAWKVVEKLAEGGFWLKLTTPFAPGELCHAGFTPHNTTGWNGGPDHAASDERPARAICLAALATKNAAAERRAG